VKLQATAWPALLTASFLVLLVAVVLHPGPLPSDVGIMRGVQHVLGVLPASDAVGYVLLFGPVVIVLPVLLYERRWAAAVWFFGALLTSVLGSGILQVVLGRPGPSSSYGDSFPSVSVAEALVLGALVVYFGWKRFGSGRYVVIILAIAYVAVVSVLPIDTEGHWPSDVLGGLIFGATWTILAFLVAAQWAARARPGSDVSWSFYGLPTTGTNLARGCARPTPSRSFPKWPFRRTAFKRHGTNR
jgi:membrane-associated phospholipid phosphatase